MVIVCIYIPHVILSTRISITTIIITHMYILVKKKHRWWFFFPKMQIYILSHPFLYIFFLSDIFFSF